MSLDDRDSPPPRCVTARVEVDPADLDGLPRALRDAGAWLRAGKLVAFPTETVYGLGANALDEEAVRRVFEAKGRPAFNPLIVHVDSLERVGEVAREVPAQARELAAVFWPGPLTIVLPRSAAVSDVVTGGLDTVGVRVPAHPVARALLAEAKVPVAAPSANPFTQVSPTTAQHVLARLDGRIDAVIDGGPTNVGIESTVVAIDGDGALVLLRHGGISREQLQQRGFVVVEASDDEDDGAARRSPGRVERHYAPGMPLTAVARGASGALDLPASDAAFAVLARGDAAGAAGARATEVLPVDVAGFTRGLYAALHRIAASGCEVAYVEALPEDPAWRAVADRLRRAGL
ncbi:MAG: L-threonylcarbamoyladenylate synthase [Planctomycetota bacterium]|nr:L-threonylcarbamoyladenylate synthase [Planctomycetota bacterium]